MGWTKSLKKVSYALSAPAFWLGAWQVCAFLVDRHVGGKGNELLLPYPATVLAELLRLAGQSVFWQSVLTTLLRVMAGLLAGVCLGGLLAALTSASTWCDRLLSPAIRVVRAAPVASFILLVLLWTGRDTVPTVISALMVLPVVWDSLCRGIRATDRKLLELARAYRFPPLKTIKLIYLPSLRPYILTALTTGTGLAWKSGVAAEVLCLPSLALGTRIFQTKYYLEIPQLFAWTAVTAALSLLLERIIRLALARSERGRSV